MRVKTVQGYICPECETLTLEAPTKSRGYRCGLCDQVHETERVEISPGWRCDGVNDSGLTTEEPTKTMVIYLECCGEVVEADGIDAPTLTDLFAYDCSCLTDEEPERQDLFQCGACEELYEDRDMAVECCR